MHWSLRSDSILDDLFQTSSSQSKTVQLRIYRDGWWHHVDKTQSVVKMNWCSSWKVKAWMHQDFFQISPSKCECIRIFSSSDFPLLPWMTHGGETGQREGLLYIWQVSCMYVSFIIYQTLNVQPWSNVANQELSLFLKL